MLAALSVPLAGQALSHNATYRSHVTIHQPSPTLYKGRVTSDLAACEKHRLVKLFRANGDDTSFSDTTDAEGRYEIDSGPGTRAVGRGAAGSLGRCW